MMWFNHYRDRGLAYTNISPTGLERSKTGVTSAPRFLFRECLYLGERYDMGISSPLKWLKILVEDVSLPIDTGQARANSSWA
jgi:hypothetical protein